MSKVTIFGSSGFVGSNLKTKLDELGFDVYCPSREDSDFNSNEDLGVVVYCSGNGNCGSEPLSVLNANVNRLTDVLCLDNYKRIIYLSSTRIYMGSNSSNEFSDNVVKESDDRILFNLTKMIGEELCLKLGRDPIVLRPSNIYGLAKNSKLFLPSITRDAINKKEVNMYVSPSYSKDYISVNDLVSVIVQLIIKEKINKRVLNVAYGKNVTAQNIVNVLIDKTKCNVNWITKSEDDYFPETEITELKSEVSFEPSSVIEDLEKLIDDFKEVI
ncbi:SDR family oxidoreductase [Photobacterium kagoshimensis]|uniref:SDR family oxidoreductase n=1 Tax=Photobacterium kagoshimensis TaxID=2910242 RepID=UPI003D0DC31A